MSVQCEWCGGAGQELKLEVLQLKIRIHEIQKLREQEIMYAESEERAKCAWIIEQQANRLDSQLIREIVPMIRFRKRKGVTRQATTVIAEHPPNDGREWDNQCARCGSSMISVDCSNFDCGPDCVSCDGSGGWWQCLSSVDWCNANPLHGRKNVERGKVEWWTLSKDVT